MVAGPFSFRGVVNRAQLARRPPAGAAMLHAAPELRLEGALPAAADLEIDEGAIRDSVAMFEEGMRSLRGGADRLTPGDLGLIEGARSAADRVLRDGAAARFSNRELISAEAVVIVDGTRRPLRFRDGTLDLDDPQAGHWRGILRPLADTAAAVARSVGRIDIDGEHAGTGWMIRPGYVATNRHVAQRLARDPTAKALALSPLRRATIRFGHEAGETDGGPDYRIVRIVFSGERFIEPQFSDFAFVDLAVLRIVPTGVDDMPAALTDRIWPLEATTLRRDVFLFGYPGPTSQSALPEKILLDLFGSVSGIKRLSPGEIIAGYGELSEDTERRCFAHDATSLGGSSGSVILAFDDEKTASVVGIHFSGYEVSLGPDGRETRRGSNFGQGFAAMPDVVALVDRALEADRTGSPARPRDPGAGIHAAPPVPPAPVAVAPAAGDPALELLRAAAMAADPDAPETLAEGLLRFSLEYRAPPPAPAAARAAIAALLGADRFQLFPLPGGADPSAMVLQFAGVARQQSAGFLFAAAQRLVDDLGLRSATPDVDPPWEPLDEVGRAPPESVGGIVWSLCTSKEAAPSDSRWAVDHVRAAEAWRRFGTMGEGIRVGQPDTGVADHRELDAAVDLARSTDILAGGGKAIDPLSPSMSSPGHGTATSSTVASRKAGGMVGSAPGATVVPIRCVNGVILSSGTAVAAAIDHARAEGCHVVTMSLGGAIEFRDLKRAIGRAVDAGMVVLAAAGNCAPFVVYPGWDENVIAVAGVDFNGEKWRGSSTGRAVTVSAPAENVYVARRTRPDDAKKTAVEPGQGTSFAVALTAGCAALWFARHGPATVRDAAADRGTSVQELFRACLVASANRPDGWDDRKLGAGIVDAVRLLEQDLGTVRLAPRSRNESPAAEMLEGLDLDRFSAEAGYLAADALRRSDPEGRTVPESVVPPRPSPQLAAALGAAGAGASLPAPAVALSPLTPLAPVSADLLNVAAAAARTTVETVGPLTESGARDLIRAGRGTLLDRVDRSFSAIRPEAGETPEVAEWRRLVHAAAEEVVDGYIADKRTRADFVDDTRRIAAEALIRLTGRPAIRTVQGLFDVDDPMLETWVPTLVPVRGSIAPAIAATGRVDITIAGVPRHVGTGTLIAPGVVMTNRHVIEHFAEPVPLAGGGVRFVMTAETSISFDDVPTEGGKRFEIRGVIAAGPDRIGRFADPKKLDAAFLAVADRSAAGDVLPAPLRVAALPETRRLLLVGYPAEPTADAGRDPETGTISTDIWDRLWRIFGNAYGRRYISPGEMVVGPGAYEGDGRGWVFSHDATTLAGHSGSHVFSLDGFGLYGLHFGGAPLRENLAHSIGRVREEAGRDRLLPPDVVELLTFAR